ncbi:intradiol ring-cleavage dioxygenase [Duganella violaceipulchra]|uniref:Intradiol ring-cleavage dioxygenase n=1 Tax=Duganella violaceipulchra TaxID=2849652 RepID=A0AA41HF61_9BURK|nr:intradiol ring-cleavage dioxygenase [Duganella violaceicalia]MBV6323837.1 intradiol ring-cleavage dioxygenase [Duganella violaceicalia]MCP2007528.1 protocatechuate 3,4-dioxygenase beta subunit [Duganella violaceicalia]
MQSHDDTHEHSLAADLSAMLNLASDRRQTLRWLLAGASALPVLGCGGGGSSASDATTATSTSSSSTTTTTTAGSCAVIPEETGGPYPGDGTNSNNSGVVNVLTQSGVVRSDIRGSFNGPTGVAAGVPLTIKLQIVNANGSCAVLSGYAVYLWHCDRDGNYSLYSNGVTDQNYLRGVQASDSSGNLTFQTIFPGCYSGRMPHVHFEVYPTLAKSTSAANRIKTSQFTFPMATLNEVYAASGYSTSVRNLAQISYATDNIFSDGYSLQMGAVTGNATDGYLVTLTVGVAG